MSDCADSFKEGLRRERRRIRLAILEADMAYFEARLEILGEPQTANQYAQRKTFKFLYRNLGELILRSKQRTPDLG
jgi:hypothetical protein